MVGAFKKNPLQDICRALDLEDLSADERYTDLERQKQHRPELQRVFRDRFRTDSTEHWLYRLGAVDILCAPVKSLEEALADPQTAFNEMIVDLAPSPGGPVRLVASPIGHVGCAVPGPARAAEAGRTHRRNRPRKAAGIPPRECRPGGLRRRCPGYPQPARPSERDRPGRRSGAGRDLGANRGRRRYPVRGADRSRESVLRRRRHEGGGRRRAGVLGPSRTPGDLAASRWAAGCRFR